MPENSTLKKSKIILVEEEKNTKSTPRAQLFID
jgi:hypothetical protein